MLEHSLAPVAVPVYIDTQRCVRLDIPMITGDINQNQNQNNADHHSSQNQQEEHKDEQHQQENVSAILEATPQTTTTILVSGVPALMSVPEILNMLIYNPEAEQPHLLHGNIGNSTTSPPSTPTAAGNVGSSSSSYFHRHLHSIRVCFGSESGTLALLCTFFDDAAAIAFHHRWHGKSAFPLAKEILSVDFVDVALLLQMIQEEERVVADEVAKLKNSEQHQNEPGGAVVEVEPAFKALGTSWWQFLHAAAAASQQHQQISSSVAPAPRDPCPICLDPIVVSCRYSSSAVAAAVSSSSGGRNTPQLQGVSAGGVSSSFPSSTHHRQQQQLLQPHQPFVELHCSHLQHVACFAAGAGTAQQPLHDGGSSSACPLCRFNCCEEAFAAHCSRCGTKDGSLWVCLLCGDTVCSNEVKNNSGSSKAFIISKQQQQQNQSKFTTQTTKSTATSSSNRVLVSEQQNRVNHRDAHFTHDPSHHLYLQSGGLRVWDCKLNDFVHRVLWTMDGGLNSITRADPNWRDHLSWADDEAEVEAQLVEKQMEQMEKFYNELLLEQLQAQEEYFAAKQRQEGTALIVQRFFLHERVERSRVAAAWKQGLRTMTHEFVGEVKKLTKAVKGQRHKVKEEIEEHEVMLVTANATREKMQKFLGVKKAAAAVSSSSASSEAAAAATATPQNHQQQQQQQQHKPPSSVTEIKKSIDTHPEVVALEKELEKLYLQLSG